MNTYGLIGKSLSHSFSADYFNKKFTEEDIDSVYKLFEINDITQITNIIRSNPTLKGFNITIPYKESIIPYLYGFDPVMEKVGACNTVRIIDNKMYGFNTDVYGFEIILREALVHFDLEALILGSGGASKAIQYVFQKMSINYQIVSRDSKKGNLLWNEITQEIIKSHHLIINTTPLGMAPLTESSPALPYDALTEDHIVIDLIYNPPITEFLRKCRQHKALTYNGKSMLYAQAEAAWALWNKKEKDLFGR